MGSCMSDLANYIEENRDEGEISPILYVNEPGWVEQCKYMSKHKQYCSMGSYGVKINTNNLKKMIQIIEKKSIPTDNERNSICPKCGSDTSLGKLKEYS